jgi:hypothetical protein
MIEVITGAAGSLIANEISNGFSLSQKLKNFFKWNLIHRNKTIRVSAASILSVKKNDQQILIKGLNRPNSYGPIGGAIRYHSAAKGFLQDICFEKEEAKNSSHKKKIERDLRGYIPSKHLLKFINWFLLYKNREENALFREIEEELVEINLQNLLGIMGTPDFSLIRSISEGPHKVPGKSFYQYRILNVYEFSEDYQKTRGTKFINALYKASKTEENLILVNSEEIKAGITQLGEHIGGHTPYLFGTMKYFTEDRSWSEKS